MIVKDKTIVCTAKDQLNCAVVDSFTINLLRPHPEKLCLVTVDSATNKNAIVYDKTALKILSYLGYTNKEVRLISLIY